MGADPAVTRKLAYDASGNVAKQMTVAEVCKRDEVHEALESQCASDALLEAWIEREERAFEKETSQEPVNANARTGFRLRRVSVHSLGFKRLVGRVSGR